MWPFCCQSFPLEEPARNVKHRKRGRNIDIQKQWVSDVHVANMEGGGGEKSWPLFAILLEGSCESGTSTSFGYFLTLLPAMDMFWNVNTEG